jgi:hypothetical protein
MKVTVDLSQWDERQQDELKTIFKNIEEHPEFLFLTSVKFDREKNERRVTEYAVYPNDDEMRVYALSTVLMPFVKNQSENLLARVGKREKEAG